MKKSFTLAEVLITLGIIGVFAAMTLPTLIQNKHNRELETALKQNYALIQNALQLMSYEQGEVINKANAGAEFNERFMKYFKVSKDCAKRSCVPNENKENDDGSTVGYITRHYKNYNNTNNISTYYLDDGQFVLNNGAMIFIENNTNEEGKHLFFISVDVNGLSKGPNRWGHDLFTFEIVDDGKLLPLGAKGSWLPYNERCSAKPDSTSSNNGMTCTYLALTDKNYWKNLPK